MSWERLLGSPLYALVGGAFGAAAAHARSRSVGALLLGGIIGAVLALANTWVATFPLQGSGTIWFDLWLSVLLAASPVAALIGGAFGAFVASVRLRRVEAFVLGGILGAVLPPMTLWAIMFMMPGGGLHWREVVRRTLLIGSPMGAWIVGAFGAAVAGRCTRDEEGLPRAGASEPQGDAMNGLA